MKKQAEQNRAPVDTSRRRLMAGALGVGAVAGLGLATVNAQAEAPKSEKTNKKETRYHESEHIRRYYRKAFEV